MLDVVQRSVARKRSIFNTYAAVASGRVVITEVDCAHAHYTLVFIHAQCMYVYIHTCTVYVRVHTLVFIHTLL